MLGPKADIRTGTQEKWQKAVATSDGSRHEPTRTAFEGRRIARCDPKKQPDNRRAYAIPTEGRVDEDLKDESDMRRTLGCQRK